MAARKTFTVTLDGNWQRITSNQRLFAEYSVHFSSNNQAGNILLVDTGDCVDPASPADTEAFDVLAAPGDDRVVPVPRDMLRLPVGVTTGPGIDQKKLYDYKVKGTAGDVLYVEAQ